MLRCRASRTRHLLYVLVARATVPSVLFSAAWACRTIGQLVIPPQSRPADNAVVLESCKTIKRLSLFLFQSKLQIRFLGLIELRPRPVEEWDSFLRQLAQAERALSPESARLTAAAVIVLDGRTLDSVTSTSVDQSFLRALKREGDYQKLQASEMREVEEDVVSNLPPIRIVCVGTDLKGRPVLVLYWLSFQGDGGATASALAMWNEQKHCVELLLTTK